MFLKLKKSYWLVAYTKKKSPKQYRYMACGDSLLDVYRQHVDSPFYGSTTVVSIIQIQDNDERKYECL